MNLIRNVKLAPEGTGDENKKPAEDRTKYIDTVKTSAITQAKIQKAVMATVKTLQASKPTVVANFDICFELANGGTPVMTHWTAAANAKTGKVFVHGPQRTVRTRGTVPNEDTESDKDKEPDEEYNDDYDEDE